MTRTAAASGAGWVAGATVFVLAVYALLNLSLAALHPGPRDIPFLIGLVALALPYRLPRRPGERGNVTVLIVSAAAPLPLFAAPTGEGTSAAVLYIVLLCIFVVAMLGLPIRLGARSVLPFVTALLIGFAVVSGDEPQAPSTSPPPLFNFQVLICTGLMLMTTPFYTQLGPRAVRAEDGPSHRDATRAG